MSVSYSISVWTALLLTLAVFSGLYRENVFYKFAESLFIGVSAGYFAAMWLFSVLVPVFKSTVDGNYLLLIPVFSGLLLFIPAKERTKYSKFVLLPSMFIAMLCLAVSVPVYFQAYIYEMISSSIIPLISFAKDGSIRWDLTINAVISIVGVVSVLFFLVSRHKNSSLFTSLAGETGRFYLLVAIGVSFGYTLVSRIVLLTGRLEFIVTNIFNIVLQ
ncbi:MAG: hypothetical protein ACOX2F_07500 [bacterium]